MIRIEELKELPPPYEIFEFKPCEPKRFRVVRFEFGRMTISPRWPGAPSEKVVLACRIHVDPKTKPTFPPYWDVTPARLVHQLLALSRAPIPEGMELEIHRDISGPAAHFSVRWVPIG
jgi:hypothetical protein